MQIGKVSDAAKDAQHGMSAALKALAGLKSDAKGDDAKQRVLASLESQAQQIQEACKALTSEAQKHAR